MLGNIYCTIHRDTVREVNVIVGEITEEQQKKLERKVSRAMSAGLQVEGCWIALVLGHFDPLGHGVSSSVLFTLGRTCHRLLWVTAPKGWLTVIYREGSPGNLDTSTPRASQHRDSPSHTRGSRRPDPVRLWRTPG